MAEQNQNEKLPKMYKTSNLVGKKFRVLGGPYSVLKSDFGYYKKYGTGLLFKEQDGQLMRFDNKNKQWVNDDKNNYWYEDENGKKRNHVQANSRFVIEFDKPTTVEVYMGGKYNKTVQKCEIELVGSQMFGQAKRMLDKINELELMGHTKENVYLTIEKNGIMYEFRFAGVVQNQEQNSQPQQSTPHQPESQESVPKPPHMKENETTEKPSLSEYNQDIEDMITKLKEKGINDKSKLKMYLSDKDLGLGLDEETADKIIKERFNL